MTETHTLDHHPAAGAAPASVAARRDRVVGAAGLAFTVLLVPVIAIPHASLDYPLDEPPAATVITAFYRTHHSLEMYQTVMHSLAAVALLVFGVALAGQVRRFEAGVDRLASRLVAAGAVGVSAVMLVTMMIVSGALLLTDDIDGHLLGGLYLLGWSEHFKALYLVPVLLAPACAVLRRARALPAAVTWTGQLVSLLALVAMVAGIGKGTEMLMYPVFFLLIVWVTVTAVVALTRGIGVRGA